MKVYGVWSHGWEHSTLYGLYTTREAAEQHREAGDATGWGPLVIEEWTVDDKFQGLGGYGMAKSFEQEDGS